MARPFEVHRQALKPLLKPVLEVELFVLRRDGFDQLPSLDCLNALLEYVERGGLLGHVVPSKSSLGGTTPQCLYMVVRETP